MRPKNIDVKFGQFDTDIIISYTLCIDFKEDKEHNKSVFYDELKMVTTGMMKTQNDIMVFNVISHKLDIGNKYAQTSYPVRDTLKTTENEYREFLSTFGYSLN